MQGKKNIVVNREEPAPMKVRGIRLQRFVTDYGTFATTTAVAMGHTMNQISKRKPNKQLLSLLNLGV